MARVTYLGQPLEVPDSNIVLLDYYRGEGAEVLLDRDVQARAAELEAWVTGSTVADVLARVEAEPGLAGSVWAVEQARGDQARVTLLDALQARTVPGPSPLWAPTGETAADGGPEPVQGDTGPQPGPTPDPAA